jgi:ATP-dependent protease HslVU (ClpYQ) peptidase subunit
LTTVLSVARDGQVWMAADSLVSVCDRPMPGAVKKVLRLPAGDGYFLLGIAGDGALAGLARRFMRVNVVPGAGDDPQEFADDVAQMLTELAREHGILDEGRMDGTLLLGWGGQLWTVVHAQALPHPDGTGAVGSGADAALGAVDALLGVGVQPVEAVVRAVQIAIGRDINSDAPVLVEVLGPPAEPAAVESAAAAVGATAGEKHGHVVGE